MDRIRATDPVPAQDWKPEIGDRVAVNCNGYQWTVVGMTTIVPGVVDVHMFDGSNYISRAMGYVQREFHPVPQQQPSSMEKP